MQVLIHFNPVWIQVSIGQPEYVRLEKKYKRKGGCLFIEGIPHENQDEFLDLLKKNKESDYRTICIVDDLMNESKGGAGEKFIDKLFT